ncbi:hypothetical protein AB0A77_37945 [Streptomyces varsoviensis]|uniref:hypothetical protein n=1 Tax=Streptomyces varsoviensis TaxID=67373 RepID=UPI0033EE60C7
MMRTAADETEVYRLNPRLKTITVKGADVQPGDHLYQYKHQAGVRVGAMWCGRVPGGTAWDRYRVNFREADFPWGYGSISPLVEYPVQRSGVYVEGWSPEDCDKRRNELFEELRRVELDGEDAELRPIFDPDSRTYSVQLWKAGELAATHGTTDNFRYSEEPLEAIDAFLSEQGITRAITDDEAFRVRAGLKYARGGMEWAAFTG